MSYKLTNVSRGQIVCDLATEGSSLRLNIRESRTVKENEITPHIKNLMKKGLILCEEVLERETTSTKKKAVKKDSNKDKEE